MANEDSWQQYRSSFLLISEEMLSMNELIKDKMENAWS
jgi:hypothetical protein